jgi:hypothetical protein
MNKSFSIDYWNKTLLREDTIQMFLNNFVEKNLVLLCSLIDENGIIVASKIDESLEKSVEDELLILAYGLNPLVNNKEGILLIERGIEPMSYFDIDTSEVMVFIKYIKEGVRLITIIPSWVGLDSILPEFKKIIKILSNNFKCKTVQEDMQYNLML